MNLIPQPAISTAHVVATKDRLGGSRIASIVRAWHAIDSRCVTCLSPTWVDTMPADMTAGDKATFGHIVPASAIAAYDSNGKRPGYTADNGLLQCADCNASMGATSITRGYYVPTYIGTFPKAVAKPAATADKASAKAAARAGIGY